jgi:hypothetical protein
LTRKLSVSLRPCAVTSPFAAHTRRIVSGPKKTPYLPGAVPAESKTVIGQRCSHYRHQICRNCRRNVLKSSDTRALDSRTCRLLPKSSAGGVVSCTSHSAFVRGAACCGGMYWHVSECVVPALEVELPGNSRTGKQPAASTSGQQAMRLIVTVHPVKNTGWR